MAARHRLRPLVILAAIAAALAVVRNVAIARNERRPATATVDRPATSDPSLNGTAPGADARTVDLRHGSVRGRA